MKGEQVKNLFKQTSVKVTGAVLAAAIAVGSIWAVNYQATNVPELVSFVDTEEVVTISEEEVPLSDTQVTTSTKTTKTTTKVKLSTAATSTYSVKGKTKTSTSTKTATTASSKTTTKTTVKTTTTDKYTEGSKICKQVTTEKTTIKKTVVTTSASTSSSASASSSDTASSTSVTTTATTAKTIEALAPKVDSKVVTAWNTLGFSFVLNSSVSYSGLFDAKSQTITLKSADNTVYHELGHFVSFVAGNIDTSSSFVSVYNSEKDLYTAYNKSYVTQDSSEYFAESFKEYTLDPATLKASRPQTYAAIEAALEKLTTSQITKIKTVYSSVWNS